MEEQSNPRMKDRIEKQGKHVLITWKGKTQHLAQWARDLGLTVTALHYRLRLKNWPLALAMQTELAKSSPRFHGTREMYSTWGCKCADCRSWAKTAKEALKEGTEYIPIKAPNSVDDGRWYCEGKGRTKFFKWKNQIKSMAQWAAIYGLHEKTLYYRLMVKQMDIRSALKKSSDRIRGKMVHGTKTAYDFYKCRCEKCRAANAAYCRDLYRRKRSAEVGSNKG